MVMANQGLMPGPEGPDTTSTGRRRSPPDHHTSHDLVTERLLDAAIISLICSVVAADLYQFIVAYSHSIFKVSYLYVIKSQRCYLQPEHVTVCCGTRSQHSSSHTKAICSQILVSFNAISSSIVVL